MILFVLFFYDICKVINLSFAYIRDEVLVHSNSENRYLRYLSVFNSKNMCALNPKRGAVWLSSVNSKRAQVRRESSNAMLMNFGVFLKYKNVNPLRQ